jgi:hypothetical protein
MSGPARRFLHYFYNFSGTMRRGEFSACRRGQAMTDLTAKHIYRTPGDRAGWQRVLLAVLACATMTLIATPLLAYLDLANIVMLFRACPTFCACDAENSRMDGGL